MSEANPASAGQWPLTFNTPLSECLFAVVDIETTGGSMRDSRIIEVAGVQILPPFRIDLAGAFVSLINPHMPIDRGAQAIHGITDDMVKDAPEEYEVIKSLNSFLARAIFVAHNAPFDLGYITESFKTMRISSSVTYSLDTLRISRKLLPKLKSHNLDSLMEYYGITSTLPSGKRHRALYDADITATLFVKQLMALYDMGIGTVGDIYAFL